jgi:hypothetical protein
MYYIVLVYLQPNNNNEQKKQTGDFNLHIFETDNSIQNTKHPLSDTSTPLHYTL